MALSRSGCSDVKDDTVAFVSGLAIDGWPRERMLKEIVDCGDPPRFICPQAFHWCPAEGYTRSEVYALCLEWLGDA